MILATVLFVSSIAAAAPADTSSFRADSSVKEVSAGPVASLLVSGLAAETDTARKRPRAIEVSDAYATRLKIHLYGSYLMYPLFASQAIAGTKIYPDPRNAPDWAKTTHRVGATALAVVFTSNTVTGLWNLWDSRAAEKGRTKRYLHALFMLASDAGFTYAGAKLSDEAENDADKRSLHRTIAYSSMGVALTGIAIVKFLPED
jgi:hypothetical protein